MNTKNSLRSTTLEILPIGVKTANLLFGVTMY